MARTYRNTDTTDKRQMVRQEQELRELRQWRENLPQEGQ
jgi:hypothetical protein